MDNFHVPTFTVIASMPNADKWPNGKHSCPNHCNDRLGAKCLKKPKLE